MERRCNVTVSQLHALMDGSDSLQVRSMPHGWRHGLASQFHRTSSVAHEWPLVGDDIMQYGARGQTKVRLGRVRLQL
ncbi:hypothetical protein HAX54_037473 [Datura stramonium]|uniref:Uncharacterized protein n=1 Tax=Datura stramonium TaxID=4076 RepID=A0ABS8VM88_DATST|nr:hypothetical protein [Datura stramonium]